MSKKIISVFLIFAISLSLFAVPVHAAEGKSATASSTGSFWQMVANSPFMQYLIGTFSNSIFGDGTVCPSSPDAKHHAGRGGGGRDRNHITVQCKYCGESFAVLDSVIEDAYQDYVGGLDDPNASYGEGYVDFSTTNLTNYAISSSSSLNSAETFFFFATSSLFQKLDYRTTTNFRYSDGAVSFFRSLGINDKVFVCAISAFSPYYLYGYYWNEYGRLILGRFENSAGAPMASSLGVYSFSSLNRVGSSSTSLYCNRTLAIKDPSYLNSQAYLLVNSGSFSSNSGATDIFNIPCYYKDRSESDFSSSWTTRSFSSVFGLNPKAYHIDSSGASAFNYSFYFITKYTPSIVSVSKEYLVHGPAGASSDSRPGSITGDYGVIGDNNTITNIGSQVIINESDLTYTNPATGETSSIESWQYAYGSRKYTIVTGDGNTVTVTYGDENVTIVEGDVVYNIYYMVDSSGELPVCKHSYTHTVLSPASCKVTGLDQYKCELCGHTYQAATSATGHTWKILRDVNTQYAEDGSLLQEGYTIYECETCGEQYKSTDGSAPPSGNGSSGGGSSGSGSGSGDSSGGGIFDKLGELFGTLGGGLVDAIGKAVEFLLDSLLRLVRVVVDKGIQLVDLILSFFERIPDMFGAFPQFLAAVFPFIPEDVMIILEFGLAAVVVLGIIKILRK